MKKTVKAIYHIAKSISKEYSKRSVGAYSAQAAFFIFVSFFPFAILLFYFLGFIPGIENSMVGDTFNLVPESLATLIIEAKEQVNTSEKHTFLLLVSVVAALWTASKGIYGITLGLDTVFDISSPREIWRRIRATLYTVIFIFVIIGVLVLLIFGNVIYEGIYNAFPDFGAKILVLNLFRFLVFLLILIGFFTVTYRYLTSQKLRVKQVFPGAVIAAVGWILFSYAYSLYMNGYDFSSSIYGSLTAVVLLLLWLYSCMNILLFGALINSMLFSAKIEFLHPKDY